MYYFIQNSLNRKIVGKYPQSLKALHNCHIWDEPKFIEHTHFEKIEFDPIVSNAILEKKAKLTDLISDPGIGFSNKLLVSEKLKNILEKFRNNGIQFFNSPVIFNNSFVNDYWILHFYEFNMEFINYSKSKIVVGLRKPEGGTEQKVLNIETMEEFLEISDYHIKKNELVTIENTYLIKYRQRFFSFENR